MGWIFITGCSSEGLHGLTGEKQSGKKLVSPFLSWSTFQLAASNSFWEVGRSAPLLLPAQVYDNPNKLWCSAQTLKTLIGTKSNRPCFSGQWELCVRECVRAQFSRPTINFSQSLNPTSLLVHLPISLSSFFLFSLHLLTQLVIFHSVAVPLL